MAATFSRTTRFLDADRSGRRLVGLLVVALLAAWTGWFVLARVTVHEVTAKARLEVQSAAHVVAAPVGGQVVETRLVIGREVHADEILVVLDSTAERRALEQKQACHGGLVKRLKAFEDEIEAEQAALVMQQKTRAAAIEEAKAAIVEEKIHCDFAQSEAQRNARLYASRAVSEAELLKSKMEVDASRAKVATLTLTCGKLEQEGLLQESDRKARLAKLHSAVVALESELAGEQASLAVLEQAIKLRVIRAPVAGRVGEATAEVQVGSVVRPADKLAVVIPSGAARAVALFPATAIGRIRCGQVARIRLDGFPWTQFGTLSAKVTQVASEGSGGMIRVEMAVEADPASLIPLSHGLPGAAEVAVEQVSPAVLLLRGAGLYLAPASVGRE